MTKNLEGKTMQKNPLNELLNYLDYLSNCKVYCVYVQMYNFYMLLKKVVSFVRISCLVSDFTM